MKKGTQSQCTGTNLSDGIGREAGVGFRMGDTCTPMADCVNEWQKPPQYCKVASFQLKLKKKKKKNTGVGSHFHLQGIFLTQESNPGLPHFRQILYQLSHQECQDLQVQFSHLVLSDSL